MFFVTTYSIVQRISDNGCILKTSIALSTCRLLVHSRMATTKNSLNNCHPAHKKASSLRCLPRFRRKKANIIRIWIPGELAYPAARHNYLTQSLWEGDEAGSIPLPPALPVVHRCQPGHRRRRAFVLLCLKPVR